MTRGENKNMRSFKLPVFENSHKFKQGYRAVFFNAVCAIGMSIDNNGLFGIFTFQNAIEALGESVFFGNCGQHEFCRFMLLCRFNNPFALRFIYPEHGNILIAENKRKILTPYAIVMQSFPNKDNRFCF